SKDNYEAAMQAANAGSDMDMESRSYIQNLARLVKEGKVKMTVIDEAVRRILKKKFEMGLFDDPFRFCSEEREKQQWNNEEHLKAEKEMAKKSIVLLKNEGQLLPLKNSEAKTIAFIGPFIKAVKDHLGFWSYDWPDDTVRIATIRDAIQRKVSKDTKTIYAKGCNITDTSRSGFTEAIAAAASADIVIMTVGEARDMSGEAKSKSNIHLPGVQEELVKAMQASGKPVILLISAGRPLIVDQIEKNASAILYTWWLGTKAGDAIADVLFGDYNPSGKLPISFPRTEGQIPIYYNHYNTGRPATSDSDRFYRSAYLDLSIYPKYEFGYGLSYTTFQYSDLHLSKKKMKAGEKIDVTMSLTNTGKYEGEEVVQLYIRDKVGSVVRPVKELKDFYKVKLKPGEKKVIRFTIDKEKLSFFNDKLQWVAEPGEFDLMIGSSSEDIRLKDGFQLIR
ncbi:MAG TPA: glycoside hydrolase family 3 C-terminal domain-containing protein, partial [Chitinophagaceae bacterium]|nr:glycoside hydrolase family 3 C-terminal domain-containing protein [Chitinophagaceae bacterium]